MLVSLLSQDGTVHNSAGRFVKRTGPRNALHRPGSSMRTGLPIDAVDPRYARVVSSTAEALLSGQFYVDEDGKANVRWGVM